MGSSQNRLIFFLISVFSWSSYGLTFVDTFTSTANQSTSQLIWNYATGELHPSLRVEGWNDGGGAQNTDIDAGNGQHGAFNLSTAARFGSVAGTIIYIDTDTYQDLQFTSFELPASYTLYPTGTHPLVIRSMSTVVINGIIDCAGADGTAGNGNAAAIRAGGQGRCGGGSGGSSVPMGSAPGVTHKGTSGGTGTTGGDGGATAAATGGLGGGGGGAFIKAFAGGPTDKADPTAGVNPAGGNGGLAGTINRDDSFTIDENGGGSGGGGGGAFTDGGDPDYGSGGGGGAGGGVIRIYAVGDVTVAGTGGIHADGGDGGSAVQAGAGGSGGGGSILIFSGGEITLHGPVTAAPGTAGNSTSGGDGGTGAWGRTWVLEPHGFAHGTVVEDPETQLNVPGNVRYLTGTFVVESGVVDFNNTQPTLTNSGYNSTGTGTVTYEIAVSDDNSASSFGSYTDPTTLVGQTFNRYFRYRLTVTSSVGNDPLRLQDISLEYDGHTQGDFEFKGACGKVSGMSGNGPFGWIFILPLLLLMTLRFRPVSFRAR